MPHYDRFIFESYLLDPETRTIELRYSLDDQLKFVEKLGLPESLSLEQPPAGLDAALFSLHLAGGASYYKTYLPKTIEIRSGKLTPSQAKFWDTLYTHGLGEFFYRNQLDFRGLIQFPSELPERSAEPVPAPAQPRRALVAFGGGKDSIVSTELLRTAGLDQTLFRVRSHPLISELAATAQLPLLEISRTLDPQLIALNESGAYNGHVPVTAYISFLSVVTALLGGYDAVVFSNEHSSSYGNVEYLGLTINHQWSKSAEFETMLRTYLQQFVTRDVQYLNPLRPVSELKIAQLFANYPQYFPQATSCNRNWTLIAGDPAAGRWCGHCPKCAFTFALLASFLPPATVTGIFGHNLFDDAGLLPLYRELWGETGFKPFECVGTPEETQAALYLAGEHAAYKDTPIMTAFTANILPQLADPETLVAGLLAADPAL